MKVLLLLLAAPALAGAIKAPRDKAQFVSLLSTREHAKEAQFVSLLSTREHAKEHAKEDAAQKRKSVQDAATLPKNLGEKDLTEKEYEDLLSKDEAKKASRLSMAQAAWKKIKNLRIREKLTFKVKAAKAQMKADEEKIEELRAVIASMKKSHKRAKTSMERDHDEKLEDMEEVLQQRTTAVKAQAKKFEEAAEKNDANSENLKKAEEKAEAARKQLEVSKAEMKKKQKALEAAERSLYEIKQKEAEASFKLEEKKEKLKGVKGQIDNDKKEVEDLLKKYKKAKAAYKEEEETDDSNFEMTAIVMDKRLAEAKEARKKHEDEAKNTEADLSTANTKGAELKQSYKSKEEKMLKADDAFEKKRLEVEAAKSPPKADEDPDDWAWSQ